MTAGTLAERVGAAVGRVRDPEIDVGLGDLGVVRSVSLGGDRVTVTLAPTRTACPALGEIARRIRAAVAAVAPAAPVEIVWKRGEWRPDDVSAGGRSALTAAGFRLAGERPTCPYCASAEVRCESAFGAGVCRVPFTCASCGSSFDVLGTAGCAVPSAGPVRAAPAPSAVPVRAAGIAAGPARGALGEPPATDRGGGE